ncbi:glycosyltransferase [Paenibacillus sp. HN-1]|nr:glycosyltransferase [Paenibacillus sp. CGMCC 1.18879]MBY9084226.1 glycosyltransferase [Paenibacillus sinensis]
MKSAKRTRSPRHKAAPIRRTPAKSPALRTLSRRPGQSGARRAVKSKSPHIPVPAGHLPDAPDGKESLVSVIIPAMNEESTIAKVVTEAQRVAPRCEVIVVVNGSSDHTADIAAASGARVLVYLEPLGHDVGRSVGAEAAKGDILLFTDGDIVISAKRLSPFVKAVGHGIDIALNRYSGALKKRRPHPVVLSKHALNLLLGRPDLHGCSMTTVPHALSRRALETLGTGMLSCPPAAQARAVLEGLRVEAVHLVPVGRMNAIRRRKGGRDPLADIIVSDHLQAAAILLERLGERAGYPDGRRRREMVR